MLIPFFTSSFSFGIVFDHFLPAHDQFIHCNLFGCWSVFVTSVIHGCLSKNAIADSVNFAAVQNVSATSNRPHYFIADVAPAGAQLIANVDDTSLVIMSSRRVSLTANLQRPFSSGIQQPQQHSFLPDVSLRVVTAHSSADLLLPVSFSCLY